MIVLKNNFNSQYRYDIQGLRALSALIIIICHIWLNKVSGGIDIFFVISGYFMTGLLYKENGSQLFFNTYFSFWRKILTKTIPTSFFIIFLTVLVGYIINYPFRENLLKGALASLTFNENFTLIRNSIDYLSKEIKSPFQQFWALSIQFQFYIFFPLFFIFIKEINKLLGILILLSSISFIYSVYLTDFDPVSAYYHPLTRYWEFLIGSIVFLISKKYKTNILNFLSLISIPSFLIFAFFYPSKFSFPGFSSLIPVSIACVVLLNTNKNLITSFLSNNILLQFISKFSFTLYLVHWPILIYWQYETNSVDIGFIDGILIILISILVSFLINKFFELPTTIFFKKKSMKKFYINIFLIGLLIFSFLIILVYKQKKFDDSMYNLWFKDGYQVPLETNLKDNILSLRKTGLFYKNHKCNNGDRTSSQVISCEWGNISSTKKIVIVGGSHIEQWIPLFDMYGKNNNYKVIQFTKGYCPLGGIESSDNSCKIWSNKVLKLIILDKNIEYVVLNSTRTYIDKNENVPATYISYFKKIKENSDIKIIGIRDNPVFKTNPNLCLASNIKTPYKCGFNYQDFLELSNPALNILHIDINLDFNEVFCNLKSSSKCKYNLGNIPIFRDSNHFSSMYINYVISKKMIFLEKKLDKYN